MKRKGLLLQPGMTLAVEPMINMGTYEVVWMDDDWTVVTKDHSLSAHYENTILLTRGRARRSCPYNSRNWRGFHGNARRMEGGVPGRK